MRSTGQSYFLGCSWINASAEYLYRGEMHRLNDFAVKGEKGGKVLYIIALEQEHLRTI